VALYVVDPYQPSNPTTAGDVNRVANRRLFERCADELVDNAVDQAGV
jgi:hypothetical protein